jgi:hypothetical protein
MFVEGCAEVDLAAEPMLKSALLEDWHLKRGHRDFCIARQTALENLCIARRRGGWNITPCLCAENNGRVAAVHHRNLRTGFSVFLLFLEVVIADIKFER